MRASGRAAALACAAALALAACGGDEETSTTTDAGLPEVPAESGGMTLESPAMPEGGPVPTRFTCDGKNDSPPLSWSGVPDDAAQLVLVMYDPDAEGAPFGHWGVVGINPGSDGVTTGHLPPGGRAIGNDAGADTYTGPCPPEGEQPHRYVFALYAMPEGAELQTDRTTGALRISAEDDALATAVLVRDYGRPVY